MSVPKNGPCSNSTLGDQCASSDVGALTEKLRSASIGSDSFQFVTREEAGRGDQFEDIIDVYSNCFRIETQNLISKVYHYDLTITRSKDMKDGTPREDAPRINRNVNFAVVEAMKKQYGGKNGAFHGIIAAFDGEKNLYTNKPLNGGTLDSAKQFQVKLICDQGEEDRFNVAIQLTEGGEVDMTPIKDHFDPNKDTILNEKKLQRYIQILDVILNPIPTKNQVSFGRGLFDPDINPKPIAHGGLLVQGSKAAVRSSEGGPMLNAEITNTIFLKAGPVGDLVKEIWGRDFDPKKELPSNVREAITQMLKQQRIEARHTTLTAFPGKFRKYRVLGLTQEPVIEKKFLMVDPKSPEKSEEMIVADYFKKQFPKCPILYPKWPCLVVGNISNQRYLPIEACHIVPNQPLKGSMSSIQQADMTRESAKLPHLRFNETKIQMQKIKTQLESHLRGFGLKMNTDPILITGCRVLPAPKLVYSAKTGRTMIIKDTKNFDRKNNKQVTGEWRLDRNCNFFQPIKLPSTNINGSIKGSWGVINFSHISMNDLQTAFFGPLFKEATENCGMNMGGAPILWRDLSNRTAALVNSSNPTAILANNFPIILNPFKNHLKLLFVILPSAQQRKGGGLDIYPDIKFVCDVHIGIPTQCIDSDKIDPKGRSKQMIPKADDPKTKTVALPYLGNVLQKVNAKAGGVNTVSQILHDTQLGKATYAGFPPNTMILGADATHPAPGDALKFSVTSIVGSLDAELRRFASRVEIQEPRLGRESKEIIDKFDDQVWDLIQEYEKVNKKKPSALVFFRDGVSEGQFAQIFQNEAAKVIQRLKAERLSIKVTYIVVTKRHNFRAFQVLNRGKGDEKIVNIPAGTVIDRDVVSKGIYDFFLNSHIAIKGTARAAKYTVLIDQNELKPNLLESLSFALCCICVRCTRSVSIPVPVMYADLSAYRARDHIVAFLRSKRRAQDYDPESKANQQLCQDIRAELAKMNSVYKSGFYYC